MTFGGPRPNLFVIGAMKSATSALHQYLDSHPDIFMSDPKEPCYFVERAQIQWPAVEEMGFWRGESHYLQLFESAGDATIVGESSTMYAKAPHVTGVPGRIHDFDPGARIVYLMRDPVERAVSHYWHAVRWDGERRPPGEALISDPLYRDVSHYAMQLRPYLALFGQDQIYTLTTEELSRHPRASLDSLLTWLGVDPSLLVTDAPLRSNVTPEVEVSRLKEGAFLERLRWSRAYRLLRPLVPRRVRSVGVNASREVVQREQIGEEVYGALRDGQLAETAELEALLGRSFEAEWTTLYS